MSNHDLIIIVLLPCLYHFFLLSDPQNETKAKSAKILALYFDWLVLNARRP